MITEILIGNPSEVGMPAGQAVWGNKLRKLELKGVGNDLLAALWRCLNPNESGAALDGVDLIVWKDQPRDVYPIVFQLPDDLVSRLSALERQEYDDIASRWASQDGMAIEGLDASSAKFLVKLLAEFSQIAMASKKPMLLAIYA